MKDHGELIRRVRELLQHPDHGFRHHSPDESLLPPGFACQGRAGGKRTVSLVLAEDTALELGAPEHRSANVLLWTREEADMPAGIWIAGGEVFDGGPRSMPFAQVILLNLRQDADPGDVRLVRLRHLTHMLPGYMTRILPGKIRVRIHKDLLAQGFSPLGLANCLAAAYTRSFPEIRSLAVVLVLNHEPLTARFEEIQNLARIISGENRKLKFEADGGLSCEDLDCRTCAEKVYCDTLRDVISKREKRP